MANVVACTYELLLAALSELRVGSTPTIVVVEPWESVVVMVIGVAGTVTWDALGVFVVVMKMVEPWVWKLVL
jgi:hypothetical protein